MAGYLRRESAMVILIAVGCILAISVASATLTSTAENTGGTGLWEPSDTGDPTQTDQDNTGGNGTGNGTGGDTESAITVDYCVQFLDGTLGILTLAAGFFALLYLVYRRYNTSAAFLSSFAIAPPLLAGYFTLTGGCFDGGGGPSNNSTPTPGPPDPPVGPDSIPAIGPEVLIGLFAVVVVGAVFLLYRATGDQVVEVQPEDEDEDPEFSDFAAAAGRAADRIEEANADVDNAVYRAWREMTVLLDVPNPSASTPGEFADSAVEFGLAEDDVNELTRLFNEVRYGEKSPSEREDQAVAIFRRFEAEYGEEETDLRSDGEPATEETESGESEERTDGSTDDDTDFEFPGESE